MVRQNAWRGIGDISLRLLKSPGNHRIYQPIFFLSFFTANKGNQTYVYFRASNHIGILLCINCPEKLNCFFRRSEKPILWKFYEFHISLCDVGTRAGWIRTQRLNTKMVIVHKINN
uniref:Uncharacterized protein n=1 Tax=Cacopsylla melanoneura TaxID=428564 RepID=A0A8D8UAJ0_9HEMI